MQQLLHVSYKWARRATVGLLGGTVLLVGIAMVVLPGPAVLIIPAGLAILSLEFAWARRWLQKMKSAHEQVVERCNGNSNGKPVMGDRQREV